MALHELMEDFMVVSWPIISRFKGHDGRLGCYMIPTTGEIDSGIKFFKLTLRFMVQLEKEGHTRDGHSCTKRAQEPREKTFSGPWKRYNQ